MLHIILVILKIIGWILLAILGIFVLLICVTLFVPLCYSGEGACKGTFDSLYGKFKFSWLFHLISGNVLYRDGKLEWGVRIAWKKMGSEEEVVWEDSVDAEGAAATTEPVEKVKRVETEMPAETVKPAETAKPAETVKPKEPVKTVEMTVKDESVSREQTKIEPIKVEKKADQDKDIPKKKNLFEKISAWFKRMTGKFKTIRQKIKYTFAKICDTIKSMLKKKDKLEAFITDEIHKSALTAVLKEIRRMLRFLKPKKLNADIHFGFEDPSITGYVLALYSMIDPFIGEHTDIQPDFEHKILEGNVVISGKIRVLYFVISAWNLIWNKHVRITFKHIRTFKL